LLQSELLASFEQVKPIRDHYIKFQEDTKAGMKKFFDTAHSIIEILLPAGLVHKLREKLGDFAAMMEGAYASSSAFICFRDIQLSRIGDEKQVPKIAWPLLHLLLTYFCM